MLGMMEAMKMELSLKAPFAGTVDRRSSAAAGDQVRAGRDAVRGGATRTTRVTDLPMTVPAEGLPERVTIYEVGPRDGLQNESGAGPDRGQGRADPPAARRRAADRRGDAASCTRRGCRSSPTPRT